MKVAVIGAGPAGLACALKLAEEGVMVDVYEKELQIGGMTKSFDLWGQRVDLGPHRFFSMDEMVNSFWLSQVKDEYVMVDRLTRIYYNRKFFLYPVKAMNALSNLGFLEACACILSYLKVQFHKKREERTFEEWVSNKFGYKLYSIFFKTYSERLWGIPCTELDADFARQRIKGLNMMEVIKGALIPHKGTKHKTLVERFAYPSMGGGVPYENMAEKLEKLGSKVYTGMQVNGLFVEMGTAKGIIMADGSIRNYDYVVSSAPFTEMISSIKNFPEKVYKAAEGLVYRNTTLVYLRIERSDLFKDNWIYVHDKSVCFGRITNFRNWSPKTLKSRKETILALEYWSYDKDTLWKLSDFDMVQLAKAEIIKIGLVNGDDISGGHVVRLHKSYPVYNTGYQEKMKLLQEAADSIEKVAFIGRNGSFKYNNQDHSILMGLLAAENIISGNRKNDLWAVNTDYDYQERGKSLEKVDKKK